MFKRTIGICDRCGFEHKLNKLKFQIVARRRTTVMVCSRCLDEDQPQWFQARITRPDPAPVPNARPEQNEDEVYGAFAFAPVGRRGTYITMGVTYDFDMGTPE